MHDLLIDNFHLDYIYKLMTVCTQHTPVAIALLFHLLTCFVVIHRNLTAALHRMHSKFCNQSVLSGFCSGE